MNKFLTFCFCLFSSCIFGQSILVEGYTFQEGNRGYLNAVYVRIQNPETKEILAETYSDIDGKFSATIPNMQSITIFASKATFKMKELKMDKLQGQEKLFVKVEMAKEPGYLFEVTLAEKKKAPGMPTNSITGALIEVYNNTTRKPMLVVDDSKEPDFDVNFKKGNHYTVLIRKPGYLSKRMEAFVDVEGCLLCFEGVGKVTPGVADNLTDANAAGVLLANVELEPIFEGKKLEIENIYYNLAKWNITRKARQQLSKVIMMMEDNPNLKLELGSHTDSRGKNAYNKELSEKRANSAVKYIINNSNIDKSRIVSRGYGEDVLLNKCADGVTCSEKEHSANRRTELKILGIGDVGSYKPLAVMKEEEYLEQQVLNQEEVQVKEGQTIEEALKEMEEKEAMNDKPLVPEVPKNTLPSQNEIPGKKKELAKVDMQSEGNAEKNLAEKMEGATYVGSVEPKAAVISAVTDGIKILILKSEEELAPDADLLYKHKSIEVHKADDGSSWYLLTGFADRADAEEQMSRSLQVIYPDAYIVEFENGFLK